MDAVVKGLIGGSTASLLLLVGGSIAVFSGLWEKWSSPQVFFIWLSVLSALTVGQLYMTTTIAFAIQGSE
jgi:hypothetical protein